MPGAEFTRATALCWGTSLNNSLIYNLTGEPYSYQRNILNNVLPKDHGAFNFMHLDKEKSYNWSDLLPK